MADSQNKTQSVPAPRDRHLRDMANCIRFLAMDAVQKAKSGHAANLYRRRRGTRSLVGADLKLDVRT